MEQSYKEKYEQAIERLKQWDREHPCAGYVLSDRDKFIFPELAENKDERIRKALLDAMNDYNPDSIIWDDIRAEEIAAWLEKQETSYTKRDVDDAFVEGMVFAKDELEKQGDSFIKWNKNTKDNKPEKHHSVLMKTTHGIAEGEWQGEKWFQYRWSSRLKDSDVLFWIELSDIEKQGETFPVLSNSSNIGKDEQKPAEQQMYWTEEEIEPIISDYLCGREHYGGMIGRLCHLKPKQKQTEWGEDDEAFLDDILCKLEHDLILNKDEKDWLKSLRPQNRWKPSDEQMECLSDAIEHYNSLGYPASKLKELLNDLKKLKEGKV